MSPFDAGFVILIVSVIGYLVANRLPRLRRYRTMILAVGVLAFAVGLYVDCDQAVAGFKHGYNDYRK
jgi:uncharacterized membrane protein YqgA involved in biofilm formation